ncbi:MAG: lipid-A-disaccharide synthase [Gammaproteobacteria bacterium]|nr:lipid-A-disaccharide synthase [Gammaproteobacteria bacterium]MCY4217771.1 lipid-A-disaccharide synthase [Gammaproteobacteria bacterium]
MISERSVVVGIVAGEVSGDALGAGLMHRFKILYPNARFIGVGGPKMREAGCEILYEMRDIGLMGLDELPTRLISIIRIRISLFRTFILEKTDVFIGVDVPDFNLALAGRLKKQGIPTVHYVSPTVWAWREYRINKIRRSIDQMLVLFPFEIDYYKKHQVPVHFVGHPIADQIEQPNRERARSRLNLDIDGDQYLIALMPGSRSNEIQRHGGILLEAARFLFQSDPAFRFVIPFASSRMRELFHRLYGKVSDLPITYIDGCSREVLEACDLAVLASGTAALEAALMERRHVVVYKVSLLTWLVFRMLRKVEYYSMPNHLLSRPAIPELIQDRATALRIFECVQTLIHDAEQASWLESEFRALRYRLQRNASQNAAECVADIVRKSRC